MKTIYVIPAIAAVTLALTFAAVVPSFAASKV
jgi:hypothetical protein